MGDITLILNAVQQGDPRGAAELLPIVYDELRHLASRKMAREAPGHTLQPTALVHEARMRLGGSYPTPRWASFGRNTTAMLSTLRRSCRALAIKSPFRAASKMSRW